ncbi:Ribosomal RNA small subunit methyltransferase B [Poriferisphaera corsica]|uniref:Ribosomal RNA small subunit methyltransferase B n=1 Tax=Poriferisphaera corsica TaxID=2528020 RepID=A0A517YT51_9BACT|nr:transcription antitermination factor NusB [Poriferisphaera corsica]QDU33342.1 Ribosomal RNA small subunit methyltransferase B [Poriferisphaera corsica]
MAGKQIQTQALQQLMPPFANPRIAVAASIARIVDRFPNLPPTPLDTTGLSHLDTALATAIHRTVLQRYITLEFIVSQYLKGKPFSALEAPVRAILLSGAAQLVFMTRLPAYAVVDESVKMTRTHVRAKAAGLVNAVLRRVAEVVEGYDPDEPWRPAADALPLEAGTLKLKQPLLPDPNDLVANLALATSHPRRLPRRWIEAYGAEEATMLCQHNILTPPTLVVTEAEFEADPESNDYDIHTTPNCLVWRSTHAELVAFLAQSHHRRVQDPAHTKAVRSTADLPIKSALDFCAGRGTKTRQLANLHPEAKIISTDVDDKRRRDLSQIPDEFPNVQVVEPEALPAEEFDLLLLDVPCSNSAVLARRPEARYRLNDQSLKELVSLQHEIITELFGHVRDGGYILYTTCSLESEENQQQTQYILDTTGGSLVRETAIFPAGTTPPTYHDGSYHALIQLP